MDGRRGQSALRGHLAEARRLVGPLYETLYCARGEMENRECPLDLFADRASAATLQANQRRLWLSSMAYARLCALRRLALAHTQFAAACAAIRLKLRKLGALIKIRAPQGEDRLSLRLSPGPRNGAWPPRPGPRLPGLTRVSRHAPQTPRPPKAHRRPRQPSPNRRRHCRNRRARRPSNARRGRSTPLKTNAL